MFVGSTVFFSDEPGGVVVISGEVTRDSTGITGEGNIFELEFNSLESGDTTIEVDGLLLDNFLGGEIESESGRVVDLEVIAIDQTADFRF